MTNGTRKGREGSASSLCRSLPPWKTRYPLYKRLGGQGRSGQVRKISPPTGIRSPFRPARSQSLYWLSYLACLSLRGKRLLPSPKSISGLHKWWSYVTRISEIKKCWDKNWSRQLLSSCVIRLFATRNARTANCGAMSLGVELHEAESFSSTTNIPHLV
jgi:hypothetical protein